VAKMEMSRADALASGLRRFSGWSLLTHCPKCGSTAEFAMDVLIARDGGNAEVYTIVSKLRCVDCNVEPDEVHLWRKSRGRRTNHVQLRGEIYG